MKLTILGSGTIVPSLQRSAPSYHLQIGVRQILIDCGPGTLIQLEKAKLSYKDIDMICISHYHIDHISDLNPLISAFKWTPNYNREKDLTIIGPVGFQNFYETYIQPLSGSPLPNTYKIIIREITDFIEYAEFRIETYKTRHTDNSLAYKFLENGKIVTLSGDTDFDLGLAQFAKNSDICVLECSFANNGKVAGHLISKECGEIAKQASVGKLILSHLYPIPEETRLLETQQLFLNTILAEDLMTFSI
ncbi:MAG: MBL fold metallo-hydrolase [Candidatus Gracilibacteria bacterium]